MLNRLFARLGLARPPSPVARHLLSVARDFTRTPSGRTGPNGGDAFRAMMLDRLEKHGCIVVDLNGTVGFGSSWIDQAFSGHDPDVAARITVVCEEDPSLVYEADECLGRIGVSQSDQGMSVKRT